MIALRPTTHATVALMALAIAGAPAVTFAGGDEAAPTPPFAVIRGAISYSQSLLPRGSRSKACGDFHVTAYSGHKRLVVQGRSGKMGATIAGGTVTCAYSIQNLYAGPFTITPRGNPPGYTLTPEAADPHFVPSKKSVTLKRKNVQFHTGPHVDFSFVTVNNGGHAAPTP